MERKIRSQILSTLRDGMVSINNKNVIRSNRTGHHTLENDKTMLDIGAVNPNNIRFSVLKKTLGHIKSGKQKFICRNSVGLLARIKSSQLAESIAGFQSYGFY